MHQVANLLRRESFLILFYAMLACWRALVQRDARRALREKDAESWPAVQGRAVCRVWPYGWGQFRIAVRGIPADGTRRADWARVFPTREEASYYARAIEGRTVEVHVNPENPKERLLRWNDLRSMALPFVSERGGHLSRAGFACVKTFRAVLIVGCALALGDVAAFATPAGRSFEWRGMCLCELSITLLLLGIWLLIPAKMLRVRMRALAGGETGALPAFWRKGMLWLTVSAVLVIFAMLVYGSLISGPAPDGVWYGVITAPVFPLLWWPLAVGATAACRLRPLAGDGEPRVEEGILIAADGRRYRRRSPQRASSRQAPAGY